MGLEYLGSVDRYSILEVITLAARSLRKSVGTTCWRSQHGLRTSSLEDANLS